MKTRLSVGSVLVLSALSLFGQVTNYTSKYPNTNATGNSDLFQIAVTNRPAGTHTNMNIRADDLAVDLAKKSGSATSVPTYPYTLSSGKLSEVAGATHSNQVFVTQGGPAISILDQSGEVTNFFQGVSLSGTILFHIDKLWRLWADKGLTVSNSFTNFGNAVITGTASVSGTVTGSNFVAGGGAGSPPGALTLNATTNGGITGSFLMDANASSSMAITLPTNAFGGRPFVFFVATNTVGTNYQLIGITNDSSLTIDWANKKLSAAVAGIAPGTSITTSTNAGVVTVNSTATGGGWSPSSNSIAFTPIAFGATDPKTNLLVDRNLGNRPTITLTNHMTLVLTNGINGDEMRLLITQNSVGGWLPNLLTNYVNGGIDLPLPLPFTTNANQSDELWLTATGTNWHVTKHLRGFAF